MSGLAGGQNGPGEGAVLRKASDLVQITYPCSGGEAHVLQFAGGDNSIIFPEGGPLVWAVLALCDGTRTEAELTAELQRQFAGPDSLWSEDVPKLLNDLLAWRAIEAVPAGNQEPADAHR